MNDADIVAIAQRVLERPLEGLAVSELRCESGELSARVDLRGQPEDTTILSAAGLRGEDGLTAFLGAWAGGLQTVVASMAACDEAVRPSPMFYDLVFRDAFSHPDLKKKSAPADFEKWLLAPGRLGKFLRLPPEPLRAFLARVDETAHAVFPARHGLVQLRLAAPGKSIAVVSNEPYGSLDGPVVEAHRNGIGICVELAVFDAPGELRDLKQQRVVFVSHWGAATHPDRAIASLKGWAAVLPRFFARLGEDVETLMPHDLFDAEVLELARPITEHDFRAVFERRWKL